MFLPQKEKGNRKTQAIKRNLLEVMEVYYLVCGDGMYHGCMNTSKLPTYVQIPHNVYIKYVQVFYMSSISQEGQEKRNT